MTTLFVRLARFGTVLALAVVMLGAWVRLHDAGLGCPDWPGCYGRLVVPDQSTSAQELGPQAAARPLEAAKAWREMIHRYLAGTLVLVTVALAGIAWRNRKEPAQPWRRPFALVALIVFQALLGMWTVTLLLKPLIVVAHLFGGLATLALLASLGRWRSTRVPDPTPALRLLARAHSCIDQQPPALGGCVAAPFVRQRHRGRKQLALAWQLRQPRAAPRGVVEEHGDAERPEHHEGDEPGSQPIMFHRRLVLLNAIVTAAPNEPAASSSHWPA